MKPKYKLNKKGLIGARAILTFVFSIIIILILHLIVQIDIPLLGGVDSSLHVDAEIYEQTASSACDVSLMNFLRSESSTGRSYAEQIAVEPAEIEIGAKELFDRYIAEKGGSYALTVGSLSIGDLKELQLSCEQYIPAKSGDKILVTLELGGEE